MPITINGSGTVTGISAGGLPDGVITTDDLASTVPVAKAWVNFNGTGTVAIRASYNVSSITDGGTGRYTVNFTTAMPDANYSFQMHCIDVTGANRTIIAGGNTTGTAPTASALTFGTFASAATTETDADYIAVAVFR